jgi:hypothetical protein
MFVTGKFIVFSAASGLLWGVILALLAMTTGRYSVFEMMLLIVIAIPICITVALASLWVYHRALWWLVFMVFSELVFSTRPNRFVWCSLCHTPA